MSFYLTLPSGSSSVTYPNNNPDKYTVKLAKSIFLTDRWKVALASIFFPDLVSEKGFHDIKTRIPMIMNFKMFCKVLYIDYKPIPMTRNGKVLQKLGGGTLYYHYVGSPVGLDLEEREVSFPKSIQSGYEFWTRMTNLLTDQMYHMFEDVNDIRGGNGKRIAGWKSAITKTGQHTHFDWVKNADDYECKINNEVVNYLDVFPRERKDPSGI